MRLGLLLACVACVSFGQRAEQVRLGLIGMQARALIDCLGPPDNLFVLDGDDHQLWVYKRFLSVSDTPQSSIGLSRREGEQLPRMLPCLAYPWFRSREARATEAPNHDCEAAVVPSGGSEALSS